MYGTGTSCSAANWMLLSRAAVAMADLPSVLGERLDDEPAGGVGGDAVGRHAGRHVLEDAARVAPLHVLLVGVLELDAEGAAEERQVVLEDDGALGLEAAEIAVAAVVDAGHVGGPGGERAVDVVEHQLLPRLGAELLAERRRARAAPAQVGLEVHHGDAGDGGEQAPGGEALALAGLARPVIVQGDRGLDAPGEGELAAV